MQSAADCVINDQVLNNLPSTHSRDSSSHIRMIRESDIASLGAGYEIRTELEFHVGELAPPQGSAAGKVPPESQSVTPLRMENMIVSECSNIISPLSINASDAFEKVQSFAYVTRHKRPASLKDYLSETSQYFFTKIMNELRPEIMELREAALEEESLGQLPLSNDSCWGLARFLNKIVDMGMYVVPELDLTYAGNIRAEWRSSPDELLILEFVDFFRLKFVFFYSDSSSARTFTTSGNGAVSEFLDDHPRAMEFLRGFGN